MQRLGKQIERLRKRLGMSQGDLAERTQLSQAYVRSLEQGNEMPNLDILVRLAVTLGAEPREMFFPSDTAPPQAGVFDEPPLPHLH